jgi:hypothetical protein
MKITGEVRLDGGNCQEIAFRTPLMRQNRRCRAIAENNSLRNGVILYTHAEFEDYFGNVGQDRARAENIAIVIAMRMT